MKILYVLHTSKPGGAAESLKVLLSQWRSANFPIEAIVAMPKGQVSDELQQAGWPVVALPTALEKRPHGFPEHVLMLGKVLLQQRALVEIIRSEKVDIVHANATAAHVASGGAARWCNIPAVWHVRDLAELGRWGCFLAHRADAIIAISETVAQSLRHQDVPEYKIHQIYNALDIDAWTPQALPDADIRKALKATDCTVVFGCVGQLVQWKNQAAFIEAAASLRNWEKGRDVKFAIIGSDPWQGKSRYRAQLIAQAQQCGLGEDLIFFPHQKDNRAALAACDVLVHAAHQEPFGRVFIEAMALEKAVIAFDCGGASEILTTMKDGLLIPPESGSAGLAEAMQKVLLAPSLRKEWGKAARQTVRHRFNATDNARQILQLYESLG